MSQSTPPADARIGRVALAVADLDRLSEFYERVVGLVVHERTDERTLLGTGSGAPLLELHASDLPERADDETGLFHVAFRVPDRTALGAALERVESRWLLDGASDHLVSEALYLLDPEGNGIEVYRDTPRETWPEGDDGRLRIGSEPLDLDGIHEESDDAASVPAGTDVGHVHLEVSSIPDARDFYVDGLGFDVRDTWADHEGMKALFVAAGDYHHHLGLNTWYDCTEPATGRGLAWFEVVVPEAGAVDAAAERFRDSGIEVKRDDAGLAVTDRDGLEVRMRTESNGE